MLFFATARVPTARVRLQKKHSYEFVNRLNSLHARFLFPYLPSFYGCSKFHFGFCTAINGFCTPLKKRQFWSCNVQIFRVLCSLNVLVKKPIILLLWSSVAEFCLFSKLRIFQMVFAQLNNGFCTVAKKLLFFA